VQLVYKIKSKKKKIICISHKATIHTLFIHVSTFRYDEFKLFHLSNKQKTWVKKKKKGKKKAIA
jgi:broad specificity phosphatase PhoE